MWAGFADARFTAPRFLAINCTARLPGGVTGADAAPAELRKRDMSSGEKSATRSPQRAQ